MRTPWIAGNGPLRYVFESNDKEGKYSLNLWSAAHTKNANKAFLKHGTTTKEITELIFNKADFQVTDAFPNGQVDPNGANYNPLAGFKSLSPRVEYNEMGMTVGGALAFPVCKGKGRLGVRASVPFRNIELERQDSGLDKAEDPTADYVSARVIAVTRPGNGGAAAAPANILAKAYRVDLLTALQQPSGTRVMAPGGGAAAGQGMNVFGTQLATGNVGANTPLNSNYAAITITGNTGKPLVHGYMLANEAGAAPVANPRAAADTLVFNAPGAAPVAGAAHTDLLAADMNNLPTNDTTIGVFTTDRDYQAAFNAADPNSVLSKKGSNMWLVFRRTQNSTDALKFGDGSGGGTGVGAGRGLSDTIDQYLAQFNENAFVFLAKNGISLDSQERTGLGDVDVDFFYNHAFHEDWMGEVCVGVRLPTGGDKDKYGNPYKVMLGNGEHWEVKVGGMLAWEAFKWMNLKADASYHFVLEATENRMAVFKGSSVKNLGPKAAADVDWSYAKAHLDATFFHPKTRDIRSMLGYELYYKTEDRVSFKSKQAQSFDGPTTAGAARLSDLDNKLARKNTESIAHKVRFETSYQVGQYFELFAGGSFTFAGQNVMRDRDTHGGFNIRF